MIDSKKVSYALFYVNGKEQFESTGVANAVVLGFGAAPESRFTLWHLRTEAGTLEYQVPCFEMVSGGSPQLLPCLFGGVVEELIEMATRAREKLNAHLKQKNKKVQYGHVYRVQKGSVEDITADVKP